MIISAISSTRKRHSEEPETTHFGPLPLVTGWYGSRSGGGIGLFDHLVADGRRLLGHRPGRLGLSRSLTEGRHLSATFAANQPTSVCFDVLAAGGRDPSPPPSLDCPEQSRMNCGQLGLPGGQQS